MDLTKLFEKQRELDERIVKEKGLEGVDLLPKKILALQVELGELANEWRGFKFWSEDQEPRNFEPNPNDICEECNGQPIFYEDDDTTKKIIGQCDNCDGCGVHFYNPLLEEYVDCLHFILSIGLEMETKKEWGHSFKSGHSIGGQFQSIFSDLSALYYHGQMYNYQRAFDLIIGLGELLGFTWEQIEQAYHSKHEVNHKRLESGY